MSVEAAGSPCPKRVGQQEEDRDRKNMREQNGGGKVKGEMRKKREKGNGPELQDQRLIARPREIARDDGNVQK
jgi:hypothetical protein